MRRFLTVFLAMIGLGLVLGDQVQAQPEVYWVGPATIDVSEGIGPFAVQMGVSEAPLGGLFVVADIQAGGTATENVDFTGGSGFLTWGPGETAPVSIQIEILDDALAEPTETFFLVISDADGPLISPTDYILQINIIDNDGPGGLPQATITDSSGDPGEVGPFYCYDTHGQLFPCGEHMTFRFRANNIGYLEVSLDAAPAVGDTVRIPIESWGAVTLLDSVLTFVDSSFQTVFYTMTTGHWSGMGGVRLNAPGVIAPPAAGEFHEARIMVDEVEPWTAQDCAFCMLAVYMMDAEPNPCFAGNYCDFTISCSAGSGGRGGAKTVTDLDLLRRYRDEILSATSDGQAVTNLYGVMGGGVVQAFLSDPGLGADIVALRNGWLPALSNLLDGDGMMVITPGMQSQLTTLLDNLAAAAGPELVTQLVDLRAAAGLDALAGKTIAMANTQFVAGGATPIEDTSWGSLKALFR